MKIVLIILIIIIIISIIIYFICKYINNIEKYKDNINKFLTAYSDDKAVFDSKDFNWTENFRINWKKIKDEYINYSKKYNIPDYKNINIEYSKCNKNGGWKSIFLRTFGRDTNITKNFPETMKLINKCPCTLAFFSILEPGSKLTPHVGPYKGVLRYHLSLIVPDDWQNCYLKIDNKKLHWKEGEDLMFDDLYMHSVENNTSQTRVILFLDIKRDFKNIFVNLINNLLLKFIKSNDSIKNIVKNANKENKLIN